VHQLHQRLPNCQVMSYRFCTSCTVPHFKYHHWYDVPFGGVPERDGCHDRCQGAVESFGRPCSRPAACTNSFPTGWALFLSSAGQDGRGRCARGETRR
jgi:hypothetical protein